ELARVPGVGDVFLFGQRDYSMRLWVDPAKLAARKMTAGDVVRAIREQNSQVATGAIGQPASVGARSGDRAPTEGGQPPDVVARSGDRATPAEQQITLHTRGRLTEVEQFENIILKTGPGGRVTRVKDVARVELGPKNQDVSIRFDGKDTVFLAIFQMPDANALDLHH